jgi:NAD(P)-dependent dehydrogenase (short-subunit alcohol dehydrogenase family)
MTRCTALDAAKWGVRVNAVCPGPILTDGTMRHAQMLGVTLEEACREMTSHQIIPRSALAACLSEAHHWACTPTCCKTKPWCRRAADSMPHCIHPTCSTHQHLLLSTCRMGTVEEVAAAVAFMASDEAAFITGHPLVIDGGYTTV